jgi:serine/threonine protein phosphatase PrpC
MKIMFWKNKNKEVSPKSSILNYRSYALTDTGIVRDHNEDTFIVMRNIDGNGGMIAIVADGMGGHAGGEVASKMAVDIISAYVKRSNQINEKTLKDAITFANKAIYDKAQKEPQLRGMGTTCVVVYLSNREILWSNVGDSRLYLKVQKEIKQISIDDVFQDEGSNKSHILTQACGTKPNVEVHTGKLKIPGDALPCQLMLCSDGLYDLINDLEIGKIMSLEPISLSGEILLGLAKERGGHDNITLILIEAQESTAEATTQEIKISHEG